MIKMKYIFAIGLVAISSVALPRFRMPTRECDALPHTDKTLAEQALSLRDMPMNLDANGTAIHLRDAVPITIEIPTYMHVVSATPDDVLDSTLQQQLTVLNNDYAPSGIHFTLKGFTRTTHALWSRNHQKLIFHRSLRLGTYSTLNLFYIDTFHHNPKNLATTTYPASYALDSEDFWLDGCVLNRGTLPGGWFTPYDQGRTTTHEVGHWLGLYHTFEGEACEGLGDLVGDTPRQRVAATKGCSVGEERVSSCPQAPGFDDVTNFMDYGDDACMDGFTEGQARRMHAVWEKYRAGR